MFDESSATNLARRHQTLGSFVEATSATDGVGLTDVDTLTTLVVRTDNSVYQITVLPSLSVGKDSLSHNHTDTYSLF